MKKFDFDYIRKHGLLLYEYVRGSRLYGLERPDSDEDHGAVYIEPEEKFFGTGIGFPEEISSERNDITWNSLGKYVKLLLNSNPNIVESLYVPSDKILYLDPAFSVILKNADKFITKKCFNAFSGYSRSQLMKARSLKKKVVSPISGPRKGILDFVYTFDNYQGSIPVNKVLEKYGMNQKYCGLINIQNMIGMYNLCYDWGAHFIDLGIKTWDDFKTAYKLYGYSMEAAPGKVDHRLDKQNALFTGLEHFVGPDKFNSQDYWKQHLSHAFHYRGIINEANTNNEVRCSNIPKEEYPILKVSFYKDGYITYCRQYHDWETWEKNKNEERFQEVVDGKNYDCKNALHSARLVTMGIEIARGEGVKVDRTNIDRDFLMSIRNGEVEYDKLMKWLENKDKEMLEAQKNSTIPDEIDIDFLDNIVSQIRKAKYNIK